MAERTFLEFSAGRRSIRKFMPESIPREDIRYFIRAAVTAPSGCNSQCWKFVAVSDRTVVDAMADAIGAAYRGLAAGLLQDGEKEEQYARSKARGACFFQNAPLVIAVFMTEMGGHDPLFSDLMQRKGLGYLDRMELLARPDILSVGAAVQNLLLAVHEKGYGACWMNEPAVAADSIRKILGQPESCRLLSLIPVGRPAYTPREKIYKPFDEICEIIGSEGKI